MGFVRLPEKEWGISYGNFWLVILGCLLVSVFLLTGSSLYSAEEPYYKGKTLVLLNNFSPGGSSDVWTRLMARHIGRFIPGNPTVIVQNMPGAGGLVAYQWLGKAAKPDGLTIGSFGGGLARAQAIGEFPKEARDLREMEIIAGVQDTDVTFARKAVFPKGYKSFLTPARRPVVIANLAAEEDSYVRDAAIMALFGLKRGRDADFIQVAGYPGGNDAYLAMGRGEVDVYVTRVAGYRQTPLQEVKAGNWVPLWQGGIVTGTGQIIRDPGVKDISTFDEAFQELIGKTPSGRYWEYLVWLTGGKGATRFVIAPPGTSKEIVSLLTKAWAQMLKDPGYLSEQERIFGTTEDVMFLGEEARRRIERILDQPAAVKQVIRELTFRK
ncbi:MAG: hypothetical protein HY694_09190 [Deltaproteobacteria bacterium]|nr:hypothetical protein [Deltaproteobacteria bacterium]